MMEYLVAVSGQMASKSPLEINVFHLVTSLEVWIFFMPIQKCDSSMYLYSHTGSPCPRSHFMVGIMDTGASFQCKSLHREHQLRGTGGN
jgi:hypothetical protein